MNKQTVLDIAAEAEKFLDMIYRAREDGVDILRIEASPMDGISVLLGTGLEAVARELGRDIHAEIPAGFTCTFRDVTIEDCGTRIAFDDVVPKGA